MKKVDWIFYLEDDAPFFWFHAKLKMNVRIGNTENEFVNFRRAILNCSPSYTFTNVFIHVKKLVPFIIILMTIARIGSNRGTFRGLKNENTKFRFGGIAKG